MPQTGQESQERQEHVGIGHALSYLRPRCAERRGTDSSNLPQEDKGDHRYQPSIIPTFAPSR